MKRLLAFLASCTFSVVAFADAYISIDTPTSVFSGKRYDVSASATITQDGYNDNFGMSFFKNGTYEAYVETGIITAGYDSVSYGASYQDYGAQEVWFYAYGSDIYNYAEAYGFTRISESNGSEVLGVIYDSSRMPIGTPRQMSVTMKNIGTTNWTTDGTPHKLGDQDGLWGVARVGLDPGETVPPGGTKTFSFTVTSPIQPGHHMHRWQMVEEGVEWFGQTTQYYGNYVDNIAPSNDLSVPVEVFTGASFSLTHTANNPTPSSGYLTGFRIHEERVGSNGTVYQDWVELNRVNPTSGNRSFSTTRPAPDRPGIIRYHLRSWNQWMGEWDNLSERVVTVPNRDPSVSVQILDAGQNVIGLQGNGNARIPIGSQFYIRVNGSDPDGRLARLYSRLNDPSGIGLSYPQQDVSGGSAYAVFGPYTANALGSYNVWAHAEDADQTGYQWQGGGWAGAESPDVEVYQPNRAPSVSLTINGISSAGGATNSLTVSNGSVLSFATIAGDLDGNLQNTRVWSNFNNQGWTEIRSTGSSSDSFTYTLSGIGSWQFHSRSRDSDTVESSTAIINVTSSNRAPTASLSADRSTAYVGENIILNFSIGDADGNYDFSNLWIKTPNTHWRWIRENSALVNGGALDRSQTVTAYGASGVHSRSFLVVLIDGFGEYRFSLAVVDAEGTRTNAPDVVVTVSNRLPSVSLSTLPTTLRLGDALTLAASASDPDGNLQGHGFSIRGPRTSDTFSGDSNGWTEGPRTGQGLPTGWTNVSNSPNYSNTVNGNSNGATATFTPSASGYWQLRTNTWDTIGSGPGATSPAIFVAPLPSSTIQATIGTVAVQGGGSLNVAAGQSVQLSSSASAVGWLSEHNIGGLYEGAHFSPPGGGANLSASSSTVSSTRSITWTPSSPGTYMIYTEAFAGRSGGERINGVSGRPDYFNDSTPQSERITVVVIAEGDLDSDGMSNGWELQYGLNPNDAGDALSDPDGDGLTNIAERNLGKNPRQYDAGTSALGNLLPAGWASLVAGDTSRTQAVGSATGKLSVDKSGAATYTIPIAVSPGTGGVVPVISLGYSSRNDSGIAGFGWSLSGLSTIIRGPKTLTSDQVVHGVDFSRNDQYYMEGSRLVHIGGADHSYSGAQYRTELESFSRVIAQGTAGNGPESFRVWTKDGRVIEYGSTEDSRLRSNAPGNGSEVYSWSVNKVSDVNGNYMTFTYEKDAASGDQRIGRIDYTGNQGTSLAPYASLRFEYESRGDYTLNYIAGSKFSRMNRLKKIVAYYGETIVRSYTLTYTERLPSGRSLLTEVTETGSDGKSYPPLAFDYSNPPTGWDLLDENTWAPIPLKSYITRPSYTNPAVDPEYGFVEFPDLNSDGRADMMRLYYEGPATKCEAWLNTPGGWIAANGQNGIPDFRLPDSSIKDYFAKRVDINHDGRVDIMMTDGRCFLNTGSGFALSSNFTLPSVAPDVLTIGPPGEVEVTSFWRDTGAYIDIDGDGDVDYLGVGTCQTYTGNHDPDETGVSYVNVSEAYLNTGSGWNYQASYKPGNGGDFDRFHYMDLNGDGLMDKAGHTLSYFKTGNVVFWINSKNLSLNSGQGWNYISDGRKDSLNPPVPSFHKSSVSGDGHVELRDFNGDGLMDIVSQQGWPETPAVNYYPGDGVYYNTGAGWTGVNAAIGPPIDLRQPGTLFVDIDNDSLLDCVHARNAERSVWRGSLSGWTFANSATELNLPCELTFSIGYDEYHPGTEFVDINADGAIDLIWGSRVNGAVRSKGAALNRRVNPDRMISVTDGFGVATKVNYASLAEQNSQGTPTVYSKGTSSAAGQANVINAMHVVKSLEYENGTGGWYQIDYRYGGLRSDPLRGNLGFEWVSTRDSRSGITATTEYSQQYPFVGMPVEMFTTTPNGVVLSEVVTHYAEKLLNDGKNRFVFTRSTSQTNRELNGQIVSTVSTVYDRGTGSDYDAYGNMLHISVDSSSGHVKTSVNTYENTIDALPGNGAYAASPLSYRWQLGRLRRCAVTAAATAMPTLTQVSEFTYDSTRGLLQTETIEPDRSADTANYTITTTFEHDAYGNKTSMSISGGGLSGRSTTISYDPAVAGQTGPAGRFVYRTTNALNHAETYTYHQGMGVPSSLQGPNNLGTSWSYDGFARKILETRADGTQTETRYKWSPASPSIAQACYLLETESTGSPPAVAFFDKYGRTLASFGLNGGLSDGNARIVGSRTEYDSLGRAYRSSTPFYYGSAPGGWSTITSYDALNRAVQVSTPDEDVVGGLVYSSVSYEGLVTKSTNPKNQVEYVARNNQGRVVERINNFTASTGSADRGCVTYSYDALGRLLTSTVYKENNAAVSTDYVYDVRGRRTGMSDPNQGLWTYSYNAAGEVISQADAKGQTTTFAYDSLGRLITRTEVEGITTWTYDTAARSGGTWAGLLAAVSGPTDRNKTYAEAYSYDEYGRISNATRTIDGTVYGTQQSYDSVSRPLITTYPSGFKVKNVYNQFGFLKEVREAGLSGRTSFIGEVVSGQLFWQADTYALDGRVDGSTLGNGLTYDRIISPLTGRVRAITSGIGENTLVQYNQFTFDLLGQVTRRLDNAINRDETFAYDGLNRLITHTLAGTAISVGYDALGNITSKSDTGSYSYTSARPHAIGSVSGGPLGSQSYLYDLNGNMNSGGGRALEWTSFNQVKKITQGGINTEFWFGAGRERVVQQHSNGTKTLYIGGLFEKVHNPDGLVEEKHYIMTPLGRTAVRSVRNNGKVETRYFHQDGLGSIGAVTDELGRVEKRFTYDAWGKRVITLDSHSLGGGKVTRGFTDHEMLEDFGLIHMNGRIYDQSLGRFLSVDPVIRDLGDSQTFNAYSYCVNNPVNATDPTGMIDETKIKPIAVEPITPLPIDQSNPLDSTKAFSFLDPDPELVKLSKLTVHEIRYSDIRNDTFQTLGWLLRSGTSNYDPATQMGLALDSATIYSGDIGWGISYSIFSPYIAATSSKAGMQPKVSKDQRGLLSAPNSAGTTGAGSSSMTVSVATGVAIAVKGAEVAGGGFTAAQAAGALTTAAPVAGATVVVAGGGFTYIATLPAQAPVSFGTQRNSLPILSTIFGAPSQHLINQVDATKNITITLPASDAQSLADAFKNGQTTRPIIDRGSGQIIGEITTDGTRVIRFPHTDRGTPQPHWNLEDKTGKTNTHVIIK